METLNTKAYKLIWIYSVHQSFSEFRRQGMLLAEWKKYITGIEFHAPIYPKCVLNYLLITQADVKEFEWKSINDCGRRLELFSSNVS